MIFASKTPAQIDACREASDHQPGQDHRWQECPAMHDAPPVDQVNEPNPILAAFRIDRPDDGPTALWWWLSELDSENVSNPDWETWPAIFDATNAQRAHARRVLTRLAALTESGDG